MSTSRFVSTGNGSTSLDKEEAWAQAQKAIDASKTERREPGKQEGGKSLYEVLQQNKAAKQEAFEESIKLKNQFKALEEDDIEFLDSVRAKEREKTEANQRETREQLEIFRKQQREADLKPDALDPVQSDVAEKTEKPRLWTGNKKRKRQKGADQPPMSKVRRSSASIDAVSTQPPKPLDDLGKSVAPKSKEETQSAPIVSKDKLAASATAPAAMSAALGLSAYSDSDDE